MFVNATTNNSGNHDLDVNNAYAGLSIEEEDEGGLIIAGDDIDDGGALKGDFRYCLVGRFLTDKVINFPAMKNTMAALWRSGKGGVHQRFVPYATLSFSGSFTRLMSQGCCNQDHGHLINIFC